MKINIKQIKKELEEIANLAKKTQDSTYTFVGEARECASAIEGKVKTLINIIDWEEDDEK